MSACRTGGSSRSTRPRTAAVKLPSPRTWPSSCAPSAVHGRLHYVNGLDPLTRDDTESLLEEVLSAEQTAGIVGECGLASEAQAQVASARPDVVVLDVMLPDADGLRVARELRDRHPALGIVVLTSQDEDDVLFRALENGASAFVAKTAPNAELLGAIRHAAVAASSFTATGLAPALARRGRVTDRDGALSLSRREQEVLSLLADGHSVPAIAGAMFVSLSTAKTYVARLYEKLGATNRANAIMTALRLGLISAQLDAIA